MFHKSEPKIICMQGSTVDRQASEKEKSKDLPTFKDNDFVNDGMDIIIGDDAKERLLQTLKSDIDVSFGLLEFFPSLSEFSLNSCECQQHIIIL